MSTKTITITDPADLRPGDTATAEQTYDGDTYTVTGPVRPDGGFMRKDIGFLAEHGTHDCADPNVCDNGDDYAIRFVSATREVPKWAPGTTGTATLNNRVSDASSLGLRAMRTLRDGVYGFAFANGLSIADDATTYSVSDFVPDEDHARLAVEQCRHLHQDGLTREEWHKRHCGAVQPLQAVGEFVAEIDTDIVHDGSYVDILRAEFAALRSRLEQAEARPLPTLEQVERALASALYTTPYAEMGWGPHGGRWNTDSEAAEALAAHLAPAVAGLLGGEPR